MSTVRIGSLFYKRIHVHSSRKLGYMRVCLIWALQWAADFLPHNPLARSDLLEAAHWTWIRVPSRISPGKLKNLMLCLTFSKRLCTIVIVTSGLGVAFQRLLRTFAICRPLNEPPAPLSPTKRGLLPYMIGASIDDNHQPVRWGGL